MGTGRVRVGVEAAVGDNVVGVIVRSRVREGCQR